VVRIKEYVKAFERLHPELSDTLQFHFEKEAIQATITLTDQNPLDFLPSRITMQITRLQLNLSENVSEFDLTGLSQCQYLALYGKTTVPFELDLHNRVISVECYETRITKLSLSNVNSLRSLRIRYRHLLGLHPRDFQKLRTLHLWTNQEGLSFNLDTWTQVENLYLSGDHGDFEKECWTQFSLPLGIKKLSLSNFKLIRLDLSRYTNLIDITLFNLVSTTTYGPNRPISIFWPNPMETRLVQLTMRRITILDDSIKFTGEIFPYLEKLRYEDHMNTSIVIADLTTLVEFRTSIYRNLVGHHLTCYLVNLPHLQNLRTSYHITRKIWRCPVISEFSQDFLMLSSRPIISSDTKVQP